MSREKEMELVRVVVTNAINGDKEAQKIIKYIENEYEKNQSAGNTSA